MRRGHTAQRRDDGDGPVIQTQYRCVAAVLAADVVGFCTMMRCDEDGTLRKVLTLRHEVLAPRIGRHHGRIVKTLGDGVLAVFAHGIDAVTCALHVHAALARSRDLGLQLRTGIHVSPIIVAEDGDIYGHGVNIATRLQQLAPAGGILISAEAREDIGICPSLTFADAGDKHLHNIDGTVRTFVPRREPRQWHPSPEIRPSPSQSRG